MLVLCISFAVAFLDQFTKHLIKTRLNVGAEIPVVPGLFSISHVENTGAAWGILSGLNNGLIVLSFIVLGILIVFRRHFVGHAGLNRIILGLMLGGIIGNLVDRIRVGHVIDFLDFYWRNHHFPSFNVADSAITCSVALYVISQFLAARE